MCRATVARIKVKFKGAAEFIDKAAREIVTEAAGEIVNELKEAGPYYSGDFERGWRVLPGDTPVPANLERPLFPTPQQRTVSRTPIPSLRPGARAAMTIGNRMEYREIAMDLIPGRVEEGKNNTAPQDWFTTYLQGGKMENTIRRAIKSVENRL